MRHLVVGCPAHVLRGAHLRSRTEAAPRADGDAARRVALTPRGDRRVTDDELRLGVPSIVAEDDEECAARREEDLG